MSTDGAIPLESRETTQETVKVSNLINDWRKMTEACLCARTYIHTYINVYIED